MLHALDNTDDHFSNSAKEGMKDPSLEIMNVLDLLKTLLYFKSNSN